MKKNYFLLLLAFLSYSFLGNAQTFSGGDGSEGSPYLISSAADLAELSTHVANSVTFEGLYLKLTVDIDFAADDIHTPIGTIEDKGFNEFWQKIYEYYPFNGTFDGGNFTINALKIDAETDYAGLFGYVGPVGTVKNLSLSVGDGGYIRSTGDYVGAIAGYSEGLIESCRNNLSVVGKSYVGGLVGEIAPVEEATTEPPTGPASPMLKAVLDEGDHESGIIRYSYNTGNITATSGNVGGIVGRAQGGSLITEVMNLGTVTAPSGSGGIVGYLYGTLSNSYNAGLVSGTSGYAYVGGLAGQTGRAGAVPPSIDACYNIGQVSGATATLTGSITGSNAGTVTNTYYDKQLIPVKPFGSNSQDQEGMAVGLITPDFTVNTAISGGLTGFDESRWIYIEEGSATYPRLKNLPLDLPVRISISPLNLEEYADETYQLSNKVKENFTVDNSLPYVVWRTNSDLLSIAGNSVLIDSEYDGKNVEAQLVCSDLEGLYTKTVTVNLLPYLSGGQGTEDKPYLISSTSDLADLSEVVNAGDDCEGIYFKLAANLTIESDYIHTPIGYRYYQSWPVQEEIYPFKGTFDGANFTISGLKVDATSDYSGLFGYIGKNGIVKNLTLAVGDGGFIKSTADYVGAIAGYSEGIIESCKNNLSVSGKSQVGGLVGELKTTTDENGEYEENGILRYSYNAGTVTSTSNNLGGVVGRVYDGSLVTEVMNLGTVTGNMGAGGLVGTLYGGLANSYNAGLVTATSTYSGTVGGLVSSVNRPSTTITAFIDACYNIGQVAGPQINSLGSVLGNGDSNGVITNTFYDRQIVPVNGFGAGVEDEEGKVTGLNSSEFMNAYVLNEDGALEVLTTDIWAKSLNSTTYPYLKNIITDNAINVSVSGLNLTSEENYQISSKVNEDFTIDVSLSYIKWTTENEALSVNGNTVVLNNEDDEKNVAGIMVCSDYDGTYKKYVNLNLFPFMGGGQGTEENPYLIAEWADFVEFANVANEEGNTEFDNAYIQVKQSITAAEDYKHTPIGSQEKPFTGHFSGASTSVYIDGLKVETDQNYAGLFGYIGEGGSVSKIMLTNGYINSTADYVGGIAGYSEGTIQEAANLLSVTGNNYVGGIVGKLVASTVSTDAIDDENDDTYAELVKTSYNAFPVIGNDYVGGIAGEVAEGVSVSYSMSYGEINGNTNVGGIVGRLDGKLNDVSQAGVVVGKDYVGGIAGQVQANGTIQSALSVGQLISSGMYKGSIAGLAANADDIQYTYYDKQMSPALGIGSEKGASDIEGTVGLLTSEIAKYDVQLEGFNIGYGGDWTANFGYYPNITALGTSNPVRLSLTTLLLNVSDEEYDTIDNITTDFSWSNTGAMWYGITSENEDFLTVEGTEISIDEEYYANEVNESGKLVVYDVYNGSYGAVKEFVILTDSYVSGGKGTTENPFLISVVEDLADMSEKVNQGKFATHTYILTTDLDVADSKHTPIGTEGKAFAGTFDGQAYTISDLNVEVDSYAGLFGYVGEGATISNLKLRNGSVTATEDYAGAIAGYSEGTITNVFNSGVEVEAANYAGGIVGENDGAIKDVMSTVAPENGGIIAGQSSGTISAVYSALVSENTLVAENTGTLENAYYDSQMAPEIAEGIATLTTGLASSSVEGFGDAWTLADGLYPVLTSFANADDALLAISPIFLDGEKMDVVTKDFTVSTANGVVWSTTTSNVLSVNGENVEVNRGEADEQAVLIAELNGLAKEIKLTVKAKELSVEKETLKDVRIYGTSNAIVVEVNESANVAVYTISGSLVKQAKVEGPVATVDVEAGVYIVKLVTGNGNVTTKVVVK